MSSPHNSHVLQPLRQKPRRAIRPCDACRRRKTKCIPSTEGDCTVCLARRTECNFVERPPTRGVKRSLNEDSSEPQEMHRSDVPSPHESAHGAVHSLPHLLTGSQYPALSPVNSVRTTQSRPDFTEESLGQARGCFAELYGLTSDMEPILMVQYIVWHTGPGRSDKLLATSALRS